MLPISVIGPPIMDVDMDRYQYWKFQKNKNLNIFYEKKRPIGLMNYPVNWHY